MPERPAEDCKQEAGAFAPRIDSSRCEGKEDCVRVCPYDVFEVRKLNPEERTTLSLLVRLKVFAHGGKQAFAVRAEACHACGYCVAACPEKAITLARLAPRYGKARAETFGRLKLELTVNTILTLTDEYQTRPQHSAPPPLAPRPT